MSPFPSQISPDSCELTHYVFSPFFDRLMHNNKFPRFAAEQFSKFDTWKHRRLRDSDGFESWWSPISIAIAGRGFLEENLSRSPKVEARARAIVQYIFRLAHLMMGDVAKVGPLGKVLTD